MNYRGRITRIIGNDVYVQVSALAVDQDFGPMELVDPQNYAVDDYVLVAQIDGAAEDVIIVGKLLNDLSEVNSAIVPPTTANSFFVGQADGSWAWKTTAQSKTILGVDTNATNIAALQAEVQPVNRGGTGKTSYTTGNYIQATGTTTLSERTPAQVKTDLGLDGAITTAPSALPISTATQTALDAKWNKDVSVSVAGMDFNTLTTPGSMAVGSVNAAASTNIPDPVRGILTVIGGGGSGFLTQNYQTIDSGAVWTRTCLTATPTWTTWQRMAVAGVETLSPDSGFPIAATSETTDTIVIDRFTIVAAPFARKLTLNSSVYITATVANTQFNYIAYTGSTIIGYARITLALASTSNQAVVIANTTIPANTAPVIETRLNRFAGTGVWSTSISSFLTRSNVVLTVE